MDSIALLCNGNHRLNKKKRERETRTWTKPTLHKTWQGIDQNITWIVGDDLSKYLKDMAEENDAGKQTQKKVISRANPHMVYMGIKLALHIAI